MATKGFLKIDVATFHGTRATPKRQIMTIAGENFGHSATLDLESGDVTVTPAKHRLTCIEDARRCIEELQAVVDELAEQLAMRNDENT